MSNKKNKSIRTVVVVASLFWGAHYAHAAWLKALGTTEDDDYAYLTPLNQGGYGLTGATKGTPWYGLVNSQGQLVWSKSYGDVTVTYPNNDTSVNLDQRKTIGSNTVNIQAKGTVDLTTGAINQIRVKKNKVLHAGNNELHFFDANTNFIRGAWHTTPDNSDLAFAQLDNNNRLVWSHRYDGGVSDAGSLLALHSGYLLYLYNFKIDYATYTTQWETLLTRLDSSGNIIPESSKKITDKTTVSYHPKKLSDGSILLSTLYGGSELRLIKLDKNLNFLWGKRYFSKNGVEKLQINAVDESNRGDLEIRAYLQRSNPSGQLLEQHPVLLKINTLNGAIRDSKQVQIGLFDPLNFLIVEENKHSLTGNTGNDGLFVLFSKAMQIEWAKTVTGNGMSAINALYKPNNSNNYLLSGNTTAWGAGGRDILIGKLDKTGAVANCPAIQPASAKVMNAPVASADIVNPLTRAVDPVDNGAFEVAVTEIEYPLDITPFNFPVTVTDICLAPDVSNYSYPFSARKSRKPVLTNH